MTKRPEFLILLIALVAIAIAGVLACTHQAVPPWLTTVIVSTLVGGGVAITPTPAGIANLVEELRAEIASVHVGHVSLATAIGQLRNAVTSVTTPPATTPVPTPSSPADPLTPPPGA